MFEDYKTNNYWKSGDAIIYDAQIAPYISAYQWSGAKTNSWISTNTGLDDPWKSGMIETMNGYEYPNVPFQVADGMNASEYLPWRCNKANFTQESVYTWQHGEPANTGGKITTMNLMNMQLQEQEFVSSDEICGAGAGAGADCKADYNDEYNSYTQNVYKRTSNFYPGDNCGTRIFSHGEATQETNQDLYSGLSTGYKAS